jgi:8-oxo-dGTP pyrophosphatase MutT (NUDIX family)
MNVRSYTAAGGVVCDDAGRVLLITRIVMRNGLPVREVRLPKGHVEAGETDAEAARREVCEETGYCALQIVADLGTAVSEFDLREERVRRTEHYYLMHLTDPTPGAPHFDSPEAEEARFLPLWAANLAAAEAALTFPTERQFTQRARQFVEG